MRGLSVILLVIAALVAVPMFASATDYVQTQRIVKVQPAVAQFVAPVQYVQERVVVPVDSYTTQRVVERIESPTYIAKDRIIAAVEEVPATVAVVEEPTVYKLTGTQRIRQVTRIQQPRVQRVEKITTVEQVNGCSTLGFSACPTNQVIERQTIRTRRGLFR